MRSAAAEMDGERFADLLVGRIRVPVEQRLRPDDHARNAVAALGGLLVDERLLDRVQMFGMVTMVRR